MPSRGLSKEVREKYLDRILDYEYNGKLRIHRFPLMSERKNPLSRALRYLLCCAKQFMCGVYAKDAKECNVLFSASTPPIQGAMSVLVKKSVLFLLFITYRIFSPIRLWVLVLPRKVGFSGR